MSQQVPQDVSQKGHMTASFYVLNDKQGYFAFTNKVRNLTIILLIALNCKDMCLSL